MAFPNDMMNTTNEAMQEVTQKVEAFTQDTQKTVTTQMEKLAKGFESASAFNKDTVDAMMKSSEIAAKAFEGINAELVGYSKKNFESTVAAAKDFAASKNVSELFEKQADFAKTFMDSFMRQTARVNEMVMSASRSAVEPIGARFTAATEVFKGFAA